MDAPQNVKLIAKALDRAGEYGLEAEVVWRAMYYYGDHKEGKMNNLEWCLEAALSDWDV